tara:strand:- start:66 stop:200 length:135 start_codon:yes stop_codon:yes gene_type:complete
MCRNCNDNREWPEKSEREIEEAMRNWKEIEESVREVNKIIKIEE